MKKCKKFLVVVLLIVNNQLMGQSNTILGSWIKTRMEAYDRSRPVSIAERDKKYIKYTFNNDGTAFFSFKYNELGIKNQYTLNGDLIDFVFNKMKIESLTDSSLVLIEYDNNAISAKSTRIYFTKESTYQSHISLKQDDYFLSNNDTIYFETPKIYSVFQNPEKPDLNMFLQEYVEDFSNGKESFAYATFIININGSVSNITIHHHINKSYDKNLIKAITKTYGKWQIPKLNGNKVPVLKEIEFAYISFPAMTRVGDDIIIKPRNTIFPESYRNKFKESIRLGLNGKYGKTIDYLNECIGLTEDNQNIEYQKSIYYEKLNDTINRDKSLEIVKKSRLKYLIKKK